MAAVTAPAPLTGYQLETLRLLVDRLARADASAFEGGWIRLSALFPHAGGASEAKRREAAGHLVAKGYLERKPGSVLVWIRLPEQDDDELGALPVAA